MKKEPILLHVCCAPCSGAIIKRLLREGENVTLFFYNPNIHPVKEYELRKDCIKQFAQKYLLKFFDADYDPQHWFERIKGLEHEPERGLRCSACFDIRMERTALFAHENNFKIFCTTNGISRWKDFHQVARSGLLAAERYRGLIYLSRNWREHDGLTAMYQTAREERFYKQEYCGCIYSLNYANELRKAKGLPPITSGASYYT